MTTDEGRYADEDLARFGRIDVYLFDQLLRGRIRPDMKILDAGCGSGRNSEYLMRRGANVHAIDSDPSAIATIRELAATVAPDLPHENFQVGSLAALPFDDHEFDAVVCNAVLHFAEDERAFETMLGELWRVLAPGGVLFVRLASSIGIEDRVRPLEGRVHRLPDGTDRFLVDEAYLSSVGEDLGALLLDPIKTTNVQGLRAMTTWVLGRPDESP